MIVAETIDTIREVMFVNHYLINYLWRPIISNT